MSKPKAHLSPIHHRNEKRIKVDIPNEKEVRQLIKSIEGRKWSYSKRCWHVPYSKESFEQLKNLFQIEFETSNDYVRESENQTKLNLNSESEVILKSTQVKKREKGIEVFFGDKIHLESSNDQWIKAFVPYDKKGWIEVIREIPGRKWNSDGKFWELPYVQESLKKIWKEIGKENLKLGFKIVPDIPKEYTIISRARVNFSKVRLNEIQKKAIIAFEQKLMLENKAWRTIKTYKSLFTQFLCYFPNTRPSKITKQQIEQYIIYKKQDNISYSQLNQLINCFNCFFIRILQQPDKVVRLERPRKKKKLPNVFSLEEVEKLLKASKNLKHKCMLILIYSGGLRRSEVLDLRVEDVNFDRKTIFVKNAKGGKDRYTFFSDVARKYVLKYLKQYRPKYYLFEGENGGRYGESSLQKIFSSARAISKVSSFVTIHGLRHSFATHLVEKGVPLHVVQELLGHYSIKTTEIYLHISNKFRRELKSPLDDLEL